MCIYHNWDEYIPYTYLIGWTKHNKWYYGSETGQLHKIANPKNLWQTYYTSSKYVKAFRQIYGEPDVIQIRRLFKNREQALKWEATVLKRLNAAKLSKWINRTAGGPKFYRIRSGDDNPLKGKSYSEIHGEEKAKLLKATRSRAWIGKAKSSQTIQKMRDRESNWWRIYLPNKSAIVVKGLPVFCNEHKLDVSTMWSIANRPYNNNGTLRYHLGYRIEKLDSPTDNPPPLIPRITPQSDKKTKLYEITWPCGKIEIVLGLVELAKRNGWPPTALHDVKDKLTSLGEPRRYRGIIVKTIS